MESTRGILGPRDDLVDERCGHERAASRHFGDPPAVRKVWNRRIHFIDRRRVMRLVDWPVQQQKPAGVNRRAVSFTRSDRPHALPVAERDLFVESVLIGDAGLGVVLLEIAAASIRPPFLITMREVAHASMGRFGRIRVFVVFRFSLEVVSPPQWPD